MKNILQQTPEIPHRNISNALIEARRSKIDAVIVLDDDPTGTQTVHDIPVLTEWSKSSILNEFNMGTELFYILTNSRSLTEAEAVMLTTEITQNIKAAAAENNNRYWIISRSDSTLRGHYPAEVQAIQKCLEIEAVDFIIPCFFEGGRITVNDIHYVKQGDKWVPAAETPYANDPVFGYQSSNLKKWVEEKSNGRINHQQVESISLQDLRLSSLDEFKQKISGFQPGATCIVNATDYQDLEYFCLGLLSTNVYPLMRTAASLVAALGCMGEKELLAGKDVGNTGGGLIVVGSFVSTTTRQLEHLLRNNRELIPIELEVGKILKEHDSTFLDGIRMKIDTLLRQGHTVALYTSRELITGITEDQNLGIGKKVSAAISEIVGALEVEPGFLISKGGITSSDLATDALGVKKAMVFGQIIKGVPVWQLGDESKFPGLCQVIFPGNVGEEKSLTEVVKLLTEGK